MPFMSYKDRSPFVINYIGVSTAWGATGEWIIEGMLTHCGASFVFLRLKIPKLYKCHKWVNPNCVWRKKRDKFF